MKIFFQPKQDQLYNEILNGDAPVIGFYGGRGCGKSLCFDMIIIDLMMEATKNKKTVNICCVMRNYDQILKFHINEIIANFPELTDNMKKTSPAYLRIGTSTCVFDYGDSEKNIERRFRSGNYDYVFLDQAELFDEPEIRELQKTVRSAKGLKAKLILSFNMRGNGMKWLRKWFNSNDIENPQDYVGIKINPWDNVFWCIDSLIRDNYSIKDYFRWTDQQRKEYAARNGDFTRSLATGDPAISKADWEGSWDSIEGSYFEQVWDLESVRINRDQTFKLQKDWATHFISQDWGHAHYTVNYWHLRVLISPSEANQILGWNLQNSINVVVTYRESILNGMESNEIAQSIVNLTPMNERSKIKSFYLGKDAWDVKDSKNTISMKQSEVMRLNNMPGAIKADWSRIPGWSLMRQLLKANKNKGYIRDINGNLIQATDVWLISSECPQLLASIPNLMRDPDNLEDVLKTDKNKCDIDMDCADACRYGIKSMLAPREKTEVDRYNEKFQAASPEEQMLMHFKKVKDAERNHIAGPAGAWRKNFKV